MEDDDPFFAGDDGFVWPELSSSDNNVIGITMCSVPSTPESVSNHQIPNLGFSHEEKVEDLHRLEAKSNLVVEDGSGEEGEENEGFRANRVEKASKLSPKLGLVVEDGTAEKGINRKGENKEGFRVNLAAKLSKLEAKSSFKVDDDDVVEIVNDDNKKNEGLSANCMEKASNLPRNLSLMVEEDDGDEVEIVRESGRAEVNLAGKRSKLEAESSLKDEVHKGFRVDLAAKELKLKSRLAARSSLKVDDEKLKKQKVQEGIDKVTKASKSVPKMAGNSSLSAMECSTEMLKQMYGIENRRKGEEVDILKTVKRRGMTFPCNRFL